MGGCVSVDIPCDQVLNQNCSSLFGDRNYIHMMKTNLEVLETTVQERREMRDLLTRVSIEGKASLVLVSFLKVRAKMGGYVSVDIPCDQVLNQTCSSLFGDRNYFHMMKTNLRL